MTAGEPMGRQRVKLAATVVRKDDELGILWGYASVGDVVDLHGEVVPGEELIRASYEFMREYALSGAAVLNVNHDPELEIPRTQAVVVESTMHLFGTRPAWFIGVMLLDEQLKQLARDGDISGFSIEGWAQREDG